LAPADIQEGKETQINFQLIPNQDGQVFFPAFTGWEELRKLCGPKNQQTLHLGESEVKELKGKRVLILDDVISTGESLKALEELAEKAGANVVGKAAVLAEGDAAERDDIIFLEKLPLFFK
ncbi:MAG: phosphoribosyltransferase family protein, partial [Ruminococcus sp.]|nr:phosphoribosyltransferase family protein [Ruminococcus sp.]